MQCLPIKRNELEIGQIISRQDVEVLEEKGTVILTFDNSGSIVLHVFDPWDAAYEVKELSSFRIISGLKKLIKLKRIK